MVLPLVVHAEHRGGFRLHVKFTDGAEGTIDFEPWLDAPVFEALREPGYFLRFFLDGGTVVWPNGADVAPETLYDAVLATRATTALRPTAPTKARRRG